MELGLLFPTLWVRQRGLSHQRPNGYLSFHPYTRWRPLPTSSLPYWHTEWSSTGDWPKLPPQTPPAQPWLHERMLMDAQILTVKQGNKPLTPLRTVTGQGEGRRDNSHLNSVKGPRRTLPPQPLPHWLLRAHSRMIRGNDWWSHHSSPYGSYQ